MSKVHRTEVQLNRRIHSWTGTYALGDNDEHSKCYINRTLYKLRLLYRLAAAPDPSTPRMLIDPRPALVEKLRLHFLDDEELLDGNTLILSIAQRQIHVLQTLRRSSLQQIVNGDIDDCPLAR